MDAHYGAHESHAAWHGKVYATGREQEVVVDGRAYRTLYSGCGYENGSWALGDRLCGVNCRHKFAPWFASSAKPWYVADEADLTDYSRPTRCEHPDHEARYGMDSAGFYRASQRQRAMERRVRAAKKRVAAMEAAGLGPDSAALAQARMALGASRRSLGAFCRDTGLPRRRDLERAYGLEPKSRGLLKERSFASLSRKRRADENGQLRKPVNEHLYSSLKNRAERRGAVVLRGGEDVRAHLDKKGVLASTIGDVVLLRDDATTSEVVEEFFHLEQHWRSDYADLPENELRLRREIDAQNYLLSVAKRYNIPEVETNLTKRNLEDYRKQLEELLDADQGNPT